MRYWLPGLCAVALFGCGKDKNPVDPQLPVDHTLDIKVDWPLVREDPAFTPWEWFILAKPVGLAEAEVVVWEEFPENGVATIQVTLACFAGQTIEGFGFFASGGWQSIANGLTPCRVRFYPLCTADHQGFVLTDLGDSCTPPDSCAEQVDRPVSHRPVPPCTSLWGLRQWSGSRDGPSVNSPSAPAVARSRTPHWLEFMA
jgi:hypothetical protein